MGKRKDLDTLKKEYINNVYTWLTVLDVLREDGILYFKCRCRCGNIKNIPKKFILTEKIKSCGCYKSTPGCITHLDVNKLKGQYINTQYEFLTVKDIYRDEDNKVIFECKCKCGNTTKIPSRYFISKRIKSCGCYQKSSEFSKKVIQRLKNNPDEVRRRKESHSQWFKDNPDKVAKISERRRCLCKENPSFMFNIKNKLKLFYTTELRKEMSIRQKIFLAEHPNNLYKFINSYKNTSSYEKEISEFISSFCNYNFTSNSRSIIPPYELDLYYPEKKIAIEFNGDYWHSTEKKDKEYHIHKYRLCREKGILLISIFESAWNNRKDEIKEYIKDTFNDKENKLSFNEDKTLMNNNYPSINYYYKNSDFIEHYYDRKNIRVYTCGYSVL